MKAVYWFAILSAATPVLIQTTSQLQADGAAKVMDYKWGDWLILGAVSFALMCSNLLSFFSTKWAEHKKQQEAALTIPTPTPPTFTPTKV